MIGVIRLGWITVGSLATRLKGNTLGSVIEQSLSFVWVPSFLVPTFGIVVATLGLILVVFIWMLFLPFLQLPTCCHSFFFHLAHTLSSRAPTRTLTYQRYPRGNVQTIYNAPPFFIFGTLWLRIVCVLVSNHDDFVCERAGYGLLRWLKYPRYISKTDAES